MSSNMLDDLLITLLTPRVSRNGNAAIGQEHCFGVWLCLSRRLLDVNICKPLNKLLGTSASLLGARALLVVTRSY